VKKLKIPYDNAAEFIKGQINTVLEQYEKSLEKKNK